MKKALLALLFVPLIAFAQESDLRAQIRADLQNDPRAQEMSSQEFNALVEALAQESEAQGASGDYLASKQETTYSFPPPSAAATVASVATSPLMLALGALVLVLIAVIVYIIRRRGRSNPADLSNIGA